MKDYKIIPPNKEELTSKGFANKIKIAEEVTSDKLLNYGFTNHNKPTLYFMKMVRPNISFNLMVNNKTLEITSIDVLDESFLQPYDYQSMLMSGSHNSTAKEVFDSVDAIFQKLQSDGIITGYKRGMYI